MSNAIIVIPCYNEAERLSLGAFRRFASEHSQIRFLLVNDGSTDATLDLLTRLQSDDPDRFSVLDLPQNGGKSYKCDSYFSNGANRMPDWQKASLNRTCAGCACWSAAL